MRQKPKKKSDAVSCRASMEDLYRYMDGHVTDSDRRAIQTHLNGCSGCGELYHFHSVLHDIVGRRCRTDPPDGLSQRVFRSIFDTD